MTLWRSNSERKRKISHFSNDNISGQLFYRPMKMHLMKLVVNCAAISARTVITDPKKSTNARNGNFLYWMISDNWNSVFRNTLDTHVSIVLAVDLQSHNLVLKRDSYLQVYHIHTHCKREEFLTDFIKYVDEYNMNRLVVFISCGTC